MPEERFGHESPAVNVGRLLMVAGTLALFVVVAIGVLHIALHRGLMPHHAEVAARPGIIPPAPLLQPHPDADLAAERSQKHLMLSRYAWVDPSHHVARIPIERAMQLYVQQQARQHSTPPPQTPATGSSTR